MENLSEDSVGNSISQLDGNRDFLRGLLVLVFGVVPALRLCPVDYRHLDRNGDGSFRRRRAAGEGEPEERRIR